MIQLIYKNISIAYEEKGEIICGVIFNPIINEMFVAEKGNGAYLNNSRIRVSNNDIDEISLKLWNSPDLFHYINLAKLIASLY